MAFEHGTGSLATGTIPSVSKCESIAKNLAGANGTSPDAVANAIRFIANPGIQVAASNDLQSKLVLLTSCLNGTATSKMAEAAEDSSKVLAAELKQIGVS